MSDNHGNTPAAWTAVTVAMLGFVVGAVGLLLDPVNMTIFWVGVGLGVASLVVFGVMAGILLLCAFLLSRIKPAADATSTERGP